MRREHGAGFIAFGWPAFRWLERYEAFAARLRERFPRVGAGEHLVIFDLR